MATSARMFDCIFHEVYEPDTIPRSPIDTRFILMEITISFDVLSRHHDCLANRFTLSNTHHDEVTQRVSLLVLRNHQRATEILSDMLRRFPIDPNSHMFDVIIDKLIRHGIRIGDSESALRRRVMPLRVDMCGIVTYHEISQDALMRRALVESESLSNNGMVPANQSSVKKMLKRVRVEEDDQSKDVTKRRRVEEDDQSKDVTKRRRVKGEDCIICCEEIKVGSIASRMPCSHTFHGDCIEKWLKESHYCPLCRFEMPT